MQPAAPPSLDPVVGVRVGVWGFANAVSRYTVKKVAGVQTTTATQLADWQRLAGTLVLTTGTASYTEGMQRPHARQQALC